MTDKHIQYIIKVIEYFTALQCITCTGVQFTPPNSNLSRDLINQNNCKHLCRCAEPLKSPTLTVKQDYRLCPKSIGH